jgi:hypothetical protein
MHKEVIRFKSVDVEPVRAQITAAGEGVIRPVEVLYRAPFGGGDTRYYFTLRHPFFFAGYSAWTNGVVPKSPHFLEWLRKSGVEGQEYALERREYGSAFHHVVAEFERSAERHFSFNAPQDWVKDIVKQYITNTGMSFDVTFDRWWRWLKNDMFAWLQFKRDYNVRVLACELPVYDEQWRIASPIDVVCVMTIKGSEELALIDIKATDKPIGDNLDYKLQLAFLKHAYNLLYNAQTGQAHTTYNWSLMDRSKSPGKYRLTRQDFDADFTHELFIRLAEMCNALKINEPSGHLTDFIDDVDGPAMIRFRPSEWLKEFQKMMTKKNKKSRKK